MAAGLQMYYSCCLIAQLCPIICNSMDCSPPGFSVHGILQARILKWVAISFSRGSSRPRGWTRVFCVTGRFFTIWATREAQSGGCHRKVKVLVAQSCPTLCNSMDCSPPGFSAHGILQARILEWVFISSSRWSSPSRDQTQSIFKFLIETIKLLLGKVALTFYETHSPFTCLPVFSHPDLSRKPILPASPNQKKLLI